MQSFTFALCLHVCVLVFVFSNVSCFSSLPPSFFPFFLPFLKVSVITILTLTDYILYPLQNHISIFSFVYLLLIFSRFKMSRCILPFLFLHCVCTSAFYIQSFPNVVILSTILWAGSAYDAIKLLSENIVWCWFNFHRLSCKQGRTKGRAIWKRGLRL